MLGPPMFLPVFVEQGNNWRGPTSLVARADAGPRVSVEVFRKENVVAPMRVCLKVLIVAVCWAPPGLGVSEKNARKAAGDFASNTVECQHTARARRALNFQIIAIKTRELVQGADKHVVDWKPDRPAPIGIASKESVV